MPEAGQNGQSTNVLGDLLPRAVPLMCMNERTVDRLEPMAESKEARE